MEVLLYNGLDPARIPNFGKVKAQLAAGDFQAAQAKKVADNLYRARLDRTNRLLFSFARYRGRSYVLVVELIRNHAYEKSRFLARGVTVDEAKLPDLAGDVEEAVDGGTELAYLHPSRASFNVLDKIISFDDAQQEVYALPPPLIVIGSAGSGKTVLTLEKMKEAQGEVLYVTRSPYLAERSRETYYGLNYESEDQDVTFLSYADFLASIRVPPSREVAFRDFAQWFARHRVPAALRDPYRLFEEFNGVVTGYSPDAAYLSREDYLGLGIRQSIFSAEDRSAVYDLFVKYLDFLQGAGRHDVNILSHEYQALAEPAWDFAVIDEVQDCTNVQTDLVLRTLRGTKDFILCGDSNQIVHPNFFSWSGLKRHFHGQRRAPGEHEAPAEVMRILTTNYRNSRLVTEVANRILRLKHARFRSVDKESNHLVQSNATVEGTVLLLADEPALVRELDKRTRKSTRFAVIVMHEHQKAQARQRFGTPLTFSIQEAKGLEYESVILYDFASGDAERFREITRDVDAEQVQQGELRYGRSRDKSDKSLEIYKFHINALYVATTRAVSNVYIVESQPRQRLFDLLGLTVFDGALEVDAQASSLADWQREAQRLQQQGKEEQAADIRSRILGIRETPWTPIDRDRVDELHAAVLGRDAKGGSKKASLELFEWALLHADAGRLSKLRDAGFRPARQTQDAALKALARKHFSAYTFKHANAVRGLVEKYGVDHRDRFNWTPLMLAARFGHEGAVALLGELGADAAPVNNAGLTAFQVMLQEAFRDERFAQRTVPNIYRRLQPPSMTLTVGERLLKLDSHQAPFLFCNLLMALFHTRMAENVMSNELGLSAADIEAALAPLPESLVPAYRKRRAYISGVLATHEADRDAAYNRRVFKRTTRGYYVLNPHMRIRTGEAWVRVYELLDPLALDTMPRVPVDLRRFIREFRTRYFNWVVAVLAGEDAGPPP